MSDDFEPDATSRNARRDHGGPLWAQKRTRERSVMDTRMNYPMSPSNESEIIEIMKAALQSIANNTCCEGGQEAKMCARRAMAALHSISVSEGKAGSLHDAVVDYLNFLRRSVNVGPLTNNPTKEAALLRRLMDLTAVSSQASERGQEGQ